jgi:hypothetical protein
MKSILFTTITLLFCATFSQTAVVTPNDLKSIEGSKWTGTLTYLDYRFNKKTSIRSDVTISRKGSSNTWTFAYEYPDEPKANGTSEVVLSEDGSTFGDAKVIEKNLSMGVVRIITTKDGTDNDKRAVFRYTYIADKKTFKIKKEVRLEGSPDWFERNEYSWTR